MPKYLFLVAVTCLVQVFCGNCQYLKLRNLSKEEIAKGVIAGYAFIDTDRVAIEAVTLFKDTTFYFVTKHSVIASFCRGRWQKTKDVLTLINAIDRYNVPVKLGYSKQANGSSITTKTKFRVPLDINGKRLSDTRVFINNDTTFCFPFFDTCYGNINSIDSIKFDFGNGFFSKWMPAPPINNYQVLAIAQVDFDFSSFLYFKKIKYQILKSGLKFISSE